MKNSVEPFNLSVITQARRSSVARPTSTHSSDELIGAELIGAELVSAVTDNVSADKDFTASTGVANGGSDKISVSTNSSYRSRKYSVQYSVQYSANGQSGTRPGWSLVAAALLQNAIHAVAIHRPKKTVPPQVDNLTSVSTATLDEHTPQADIRLTDFRGDARRVFIALVGAFLFPVICVVVAGSLVGISGTIQLQQRVATNGNTTTPMVAYASSFIDPSVSIFTCSPSNSTVFISTCLAESKMNCSEFLSNFAYHFHPQRLDSNTSMFVLLRYNLSIDLNCSTMHQSNTSEASPHRYDDDELSNVTVMFPTNGNSPFDFSSTSCCSALYHVDDVNSQCPVHHVHHVDDVNSPCPVYHIDDVNSQCPVYFPHNSNSSSTAYPSCSSSDADRKPEVDRTSIFVVACVGSLVGLIFLVSVTWFSVVVVTRFYRKRLRSLLESFNAAEVHLDQVRAEQRRSNGLLAEMLPRTIADKLMKGLAIEPETFDEVTVYFSDIPGFHDSAHHCDSPIDIVTLLNDVFSAFDKCAKKFRVYKVETISDSYMVASGVPRRIGHDHAAEIALMALDMMAASSAFSLPGHTGEPLPLRIGANSGYVVASVIGLKNPRYCLFGDTVNTASRMESTGEAYNIHCSESFMKATKREGIEFIFQERGVINVKGVASMIVYIKSCDAVLCAAQSV